MDLPQKLKETRIFDRALAGSLEDFEKICTLKSFSKDSMVYLPGEEIGRVFLMLSGEVRIYRSMAGRKVVIQVLKKGDFFGDLSLAHSDSGLPAENYARAEQDSETCVVGLDDLKKFLTRHPNFSLLLLTLFRDRLHHAESKIRDLAISPAETRLINELIRYAVSHGRQTDDYIELEDKLTHQSLAEMIGVTRETVTKTIQKLQKSGFVEYSPGRLIKINKEKVRSECIHCIQLAKQGEM